MPWHSRAMYQTPSTAEAGGKHPFKRQFHSTHVVAFGWEPYGSSPTACVEMVDKPLRRQSFTGVGWCLSVSLALIDCLIDFTDTSIAVKADPPTQPMPLENCNTVPSQQRVPDAILLVVRCSTAMPC